MNGQRKWVGTFVLDGMLQGRIPGGGGFEEGVEKWIALQKAKGLHYEYATDGNLFSLLPSGDPGRSAVFAPEGVSAYLESSYQQLLEGIPASERMALFSTLRSVEYIEGSEIQTVYVLEQPGALRARQRTVDARTATPPPQPTPGSKLKLGLIGAGLAALLILATSYFVDLKKLIPSLYGGRIWNTEEITLDAEAFRSVLVVEKIVHRSRSRALEVEISPPAGEAVGEGDPQEPGWMEDLVRSSIRRKCIACLFYDEEGRLLHRVEIPIEIQFEGEPLRDSFLIPLPYRQSFHSMELWPS